MNIDTLEVGDKRDLAFGLKIGATKIWTALHEVEITAYVAPSPVGAITVLNVSELLFFNYLLLQ